jgi:hypothetical protein
MEGGDVVGVESEGMGGLGSDQRMAKDEALRGGHLGG